METERKDLVVFSPEERKRAVELYPTTSMTTAEVVEHLGYPTRQCLERWLAKDPRHAGRMRSPIIPVFRCSYTLSSVWACCFGLMME